MIDNIHGEINKRWWTIYIYDGYVDPEWVENLRKVVDGNILLTLPNRKRLSISPNVRKYIICILEYFSSGHYMGHCH